MSTVAENDPRLLPSSTSRWVFFLQHGQVYVDNQVITSHYTLLNFVPKNFIEQFSKPANVYFAFLSFLQTMPKITTTFHIPTIALPLSFILCLNALKDALEDWRRHVSDRQENGRSALCANSIGSKVAGGSPTAVETKWSNVRVGSLCVVRSNEFIPADMVILTSAHEEGHVYIETANLDGETNLKTKQAPTALFELLGGQHDQASIAMQKAAALNAEIECEKPNEFLYTFAGNMACAGTGDKVSLDENNIILRGCKMKNVAWVLGVVVYTGKETKIMMNSKGRQSRKLSHLENLVGKLTVCVFLAQLVLCLIAAIFAATFATNDSNLALTYLNLKDEQGNYDSWPVTFIVGFFMFLILFSNFIPISLLVSISLVKLIQIFFFYADKDMIHKGWHCMPRTSDLNEELGQLEYIFSDKTGTLTCNVMDFRKCCVNGKVYGEGLTEIKRNVLMKMGKKVEEPPPPPAGARKTPHVDLHDQGLEDLLKGKQGPQYTAVREFLLHLAINHEVVCEDDDQGVLQYSASSPDESALTYGARHFGFTFKARDSKGISVELEDGSVLRVTILVVLKFNSTRKRSSVIAEFEDTPPGGSTRRRFVLYTKGADSIIMARLRPALQNAPETKQSMEILKEFAEDGLRTLCLAGRDLPQDEFKQWMVKYEEANCATENRTEKVDQVSDELEVNLEMHGITGIEDRLQDEVGNTIVKMTQAGIKVWMLTGDKVETAINIGIATGLLEPEGGQQSERPVFTTSDFEVNDMYQAQDMVKQLHKVAEQAEVLRSQGKMFEGMVIDGKCLESALEPGNDQRFVEISRRCKTVVCCRVSPKQKGAVVRLIKASEKAITLAIGDGANDCNMIQSADVGIGIRGLEGLQAFNVCDYGISQFRFLQNLVLVHGRWCYRRIAVLAAYMFYKNFVIVLPQYFLGAVSGFSGQKLYADLMYQMFNVIHSMFPIVYLAIFDQDLPKKTSLENPELYSEGQRNAYLNPRIMLVWTLCGIWHAICCFFVPYYTMSNGSITHEDGKANDIWLLGTVVFLTVVIVVNIRAVMEMYYLSWITVVSICGSAFFWFMEHGYLSGFLTGSVVTSELHGSTQRILSSPTIWIMILATTALSLAVDMHAKGIQCAFFPSVTHEVQAKYLQERRQTR
mmetsp:Transcript_95551/g.213764  ORF Transcript_95551/g.213764 Transcript_95551/m.213764 type:complete len:1141 (+) Transcript_95551:64-3486(+)